MSQAIARGIQVLTEKRNAGHQHLTDAGRAKLAVARTINKPRAGAFRLCPLCQKLIYLHPSQVKQAVPGFHRQCYRSWRQSAAYRTWMSDCRKLGNDPMKRFQLARPPLPPAPSHRPPSHDELNRALGWTLRHFFQFESWRAIAGADHYSHVAVIKAVRRLVRTLPESWGLVFQGRPTGRHLDALLPVGRLQILMAEADASSPATSVTTPLAK
jgi:hypothetical protein